MAFININAQTKSIKKGVAFGYHQVADFETISPYISWWYNWSIKPESTVSGVYEDYAIEFVPMAWNGNFNETELRNFLTSHPQVKYILGFNEPNFTTQANMTPTQAAAAWPKIEKMADEFGLEIVGPAVNYCDHCVSENSTTYSDPIKYLDDFFAACTDCRVDYIAVHNYMCYAGALDWYLNQFKKYGKKIWLTEFACWDQSNITVDMQKSYVIGALDLLENDTMIYRYAWFNGRSGTYPYLDLYKKTYGELTELGKLYMTYNARHDTSVYYALPARIEAENYNKMSGIAIEATKDVDGIANVGWIDANDWLEYNIETTGDQQFYLYFRIASNSNTSVDIQVDGLTVTTLNVTNTGGWQIWKTFTTELNLAQGKHKIRLFTPTGKFNINWIHFSDVPLATGLKNKVKLLSIYPTLAENVLHVNNPDKVQQIKLSISNHLGQIIWERKYSNFNDYEIINVSNLPSGNYLIHFETTEGSWVNRFVKL